MSIVDVGAGYSAFVACRKLTHLVVSLSEKDYTLRRESAAVVHPPLR